jgi:hypothetical protein
MKAVKSHFLNRALKDFMSPGSSYRGKPFWAWNGKLDPEELRWQIRIMKRMGLGGFFMHSRVGLATAYLSDAWFECIDACLDEASKQSMEAWLYDEDRWPSGAAGGLVTKNPKYRMRSLICLEHHRISDIPWDRQTMAVFSAVMRGSRATKVKRIRRKSLPRNLRQGESVLVFREELQEPQSWYNGYTYLDTLSEEAVRSFIETTHESYSERCGKSFGTVIPGIFTDEPNYGRVFSNPRWSREKEGLPWTAALPRVFRQRYGYDILDRIPEVFFDVPGQTTCQSRFHYFDCITHLFTHSFSRQIGEWCEENGLLSTGHVLLEASLHEQTSVVGSCMRFYEYMHAPGMDILTEHKREYDTAKQVSSVAHQFGRKWRLSETYGCTGWDFPFVGHKALGDWQLALGINLRCQHLSWYTMEGEAKRDYPAGIFYQSPWWELYPKVEDYYARIHSVMTLGEEVRNLLVIYPVESMWLLFDQRWQSGGAPRPEIAAFSRQIMDIRDSLLAANLDFDYGDEDILSRHGRIRRKAATAVFSVGKADYLAVLVPPLKTIRSTTLQLLEEFLSAGGTVVFAGEPPGLVDAMPSDAALGLAKRCVQTGSSEREVIDAVETACRSVSIENERGEQIAAVLHLLREDRDAFYLFVCNVGYDFRGMGEEDIPVRDRTLALSEVLIRGFSECEGSPLELDPDTGEIFRAEAKREKGSWGIRTDLPVLGSRLFLIPKRERILLPKRKRYSEVASTTVGGRKWKVILSEANVLVLDRPRYAIGSSREKGAEEILRVDRKIRDRLGIPHRGGRMAQPWTQKQPKASRSIPVRLSYFFLVRELPSGSLFLALERPELYSIFLNNARVDQTLECGWWTDRSLRKVPLDPALLRMGANVITLESRYDSGHPGLETVYLLGSFGVEIEGTEASLIRMPESLRLGDWVLQGLPFYSGSVTYLCEAVISRKRDQRLILQVPEYYGVAVRVLVDGMLAGVIAWPPNEVDITDVVEGDSVRIGIEVVGHRRNSHGPLHHRDRWPSYVGPMAFVTTGEEWVDTYQLVPCGMMRSPRLVVRGS